MHKSFLLEEKNSYKIVPKEESNKLIIFFSGTDKKDGRFDFYKVGQTVDANVMFVNNGINAWYQNGIPDLGKTLDETINSIYKIMKELNITEVFTSGVSMGGYGAVLFAAKLQCNCLAFGFDSLLRVEGSRSFKRMPKRIKMIYPDLLPLLKKSKAFCNIYAGEIDVMDLYGATRIMHLANVNVRLLRGVGHGTAPFLEEEFGLTNIINLFLNGIPIPHSKYESNLLKDKDSVKQLLFAFQALNKDEIDKAKKHAFAAKALVPTAEAIDYIIGLIYEKKLVYKDAYKYFSVVTHKVPHLIGAQHKLAISLRKMGDNIASISAYRKLLEMKPDSALGMFWLSKMLFAFDEVEESLSLMSQAVKIKPDNKVFGDFYKIVKKTKEDREVVSTKFTYLNKFSLQNNPSGSVHGFLWFFPWKIDKTPLTPTHIYINFIDKTKTFKGISTQLDIGIYEVFNLSFNIEKGWYKLELFEKNNLVKKSIFKSIIAKDTVSFKLLTII